ncbi:adenosylmethionine--8-amino-7-oxononanoate transaminase [Subsaximicrobium wynnwilliamsii]|uniref:Adenosylmethionine-8-amino-7-oxononanoate aminotransferase n=1 Tax=Subsaximicrobium wynnwilliamsii TaxID=291179 RepID=A0A5C6ZG07_9FLAO|nr:adenosylmethionine--8-amino-7-oxononanoate transaminase [Subsaximicrobium wynnwilliamsii]TXD82496.1 adenosylmethionine--8-amino-7-oxononanoate transaminase [Subsaximicrobium wynnwilliamsii]TXD88139.1 adenosylmethionine--8-amino-7-oxononanoate transaminase [Subsaximicrobium wynnwilliamsii]TXE02154.1 adenosylmethionine--8-amino-7-oxononanoate transaminase [Subsaximicrobium wynnwilliamsii]
MTLKERDKKHLWHPLTQHKLHPHTIAISKAKGCTLTDEDGNNYIDAIASWYTSMYGHCNPYITNRVAEQMQVLDQVVFTGFTHEPAIKLSEALCKILPENQTKLFFSDNGSTAVEIGIKMALQYHSNKSQKRNVLVAFEHGFHGDTLGAMSVSGLSVYNGPFAEFLMDVKRIPTPDDTNHDMVLDHLRKLALEFDIAAFVYEPLVQGAAAMKMHDAEGLDQILKFCNEFGIITVADEVMTGFGKTGKYFASDYMETKPDIICLSKALTGGLMPMAITSCSQKIYDAFYSDEMDKGLFHGHTYSANPLACTAALACIELLTSEDIQTNIKHITERHQDFGERIKSHPKVASIRQKGIIFAMELDVENERYGNLRDTLYNHFMEHGVYLRPLGNTIYIQAAYVISDAELDKVYEVIEGALEIV